MSKRVYYREAEFEEAFYRARRRSPLRRNRDTVDPFGAAAHFVGGAFMANGFRLFKNGGTPLLERRADSLVEEVIFLRSPSSATETQMTVRVHLSHQGLREVRARYWTTPARAPLVLASGNVGELEIPPGFAVWDVTEGGPVLERLVEWVHDLVVPWFETFEDPAELRRILFERDVPLLSRLDALEWMLAEFGRKEGREYYQYLQSLGLAAKNPELRDRWQALTTCFRLA